MGGKHPNVCALFPHQDSLWKALHRCANTIVTFGAYVCETRVLASSVSESYLDQLLGLSLGNALDNVRAIFGYKESLGAFAPLSYLCQ